MSRFHSDDLSDPREHILIDPDPRATESEWRVILALCRKQRPIGFGALDSFLSGPDLERRLALVETEAVSNEWLRVELRDTLALDQSKEWTANQHARMKRLTSEF
jgi:hypothetical protein